MREIKKLRKLSILVVTVTLMLYAIPILSVAYQDIMPIEADLVSDTYNGTNQSKKNLKIKKRNYINSNKNVIISSHKKDMVKTNKENAKQTIRNNKVLSIFNEDGITSGIDSEIDYPVELTIRAANDSKIISRMYFKDSKNLCSMVDIEVPKTFTNEECFDYLAHILNNKVKDKLNKKTILGRLEKKSNAGTVWVGIGNYSKYKYAPPKGDLNFVYSFEMLNDYYGYDYYALKGRVEGTPGDALYHSNKSYQNKWEVQELQARIRCDYPQSTSQIITSGPETTIGSSSVSVQLGGNLGLPDPRVGSSGQFALTWTRNYTDSNIAKTLLSKREVYWSNKINDRTKLSETTCVFEPGANIKIPATSTYCNVYLGGNFIVDSWYNSPTAAVGTSVNVNMYPDKIIY